MTDTRGTEARHLKFPPGPMCRECRSTEAECAWRYGECCADCSHWVRFDPAGDVRASDPVGRRRLPQEHSTERGYQQHRVRGEWPCGLCRLAHSRHNNQRKAERQAS